MEWMEGGGLGFGGLTLTPTQVTCVCRDRCGGKYLHVGALNLYTKVVDASRKHQA